MSDGRPRLIQFAPGRTTIPTTFFFDYDAREMLIGEPANQALPTQRTVTATMAKLVPGANGSPSK